ncbi:hypothetical protein ABZZ74_52875 [Streptomyces sp. NPDC006476]|uniref:hypothetical protein n=1 Tax=Streptomyces sp. NPDC006476 TaxID=3157175 RepID=UPI0033B9A7C6
MEAQHHIRDRTFAEDASTVHAGNAPRAIRDEPERALPILGINPRPDLNGT